MFPMMEHYRRYGEQVGREIGPVDWEGFSQMKRWDHGILPQLRAIAGYDDPTGKGTYTCPPDPVNVRALEALVEGVRYGATEDTEVRA